MASSDDNAGNDKAVVQQNMAHFSNGNLSLSFTRLSSFGVKKQNAQ
jgi:hypothetical protein